MKKMFKSEWKQYLIALCVICFMTVGQLLSNVCIVYLGDNVIGSYDLLGELASDNFSFTTSFLSNGDLELLSSEIVLFIVFKMIVHIVERKKNYHEFHRTLPVKARTKRLFYICMDFLIVMIPLTICYIINWKLEHDLLSVVDISIPWLGKLFAIKYGTTLLFLAVGIIAYHFVDSFVSKKIWSVPFCIIVVFMLAFVGEILMVELPGSYSSYDLEFIKIQNQRETFNRKYWHNVEVSPNEYLSQPVTVPLEECYQGQFQPEIQVLYQGQSIRERYISDIESAKKDINFDEETRNKNIRDISERWLEYDTELLEMQVYLKNPYLDVVGMILIVFVILFGLTVWLDGKQKEQKTGFFYFEIAKYIFGFLAGVVVFLGLWMLGETAFVWMCVSSVLVFALCVYVLSSERKKLRLHYKKI
ncbi:MAG: hypothetical protein Q4D51_12845 [Eubacteriales bacterium]|nr:hypothetical protein [Eubacteriales bacterium]